MKINPNADFNELTSFVYQNLKDENSITPHSDDIPKILSKGIYFWFMHPDGYKALSNFVVIEPIISRYTKEINGVKYDLVYLGTTGTGKQGKSNLHGRLNWHINQLHRESTICRKESALSTLRTGLGALLADDLIIPNTESIVNTFMKKYTRVFWKEYPDIKQLIDSDEGILIKGIKPLLNIKNNSNSWKKAKVNPTKLYRERRNNIEDNTKSRLGFDNNKPKNTKTEMTTKLIVSNNTNNSTIVNNGCVEFKVNVHQSIHDVVQNIPNLPIPCKFICVNSLNHNQLVYPRGNNGWRTTGQRGGQNIYTYFGNIDENYIMNHNLNNIRYRWQIVQQEMQIENIENITVTVCPL